ncbi:unnamed protein product [Ceutorhynchus assimilis]|uniref:Uncharacterized protein n=1 Tax=Ceutorhynchus assimilis TaxID=467358 RepID=A0A9N9MKR6_9CUCU|nr:unnamed protein product [Ceutorhynchus assimilis]
MSQKTPKRPSQDTCPGFSPITLHKSPAAQSPQRNLTGPPRVIRDIIADLYNNVQRWNKLHIQGCALVKQIAAIKAGDPRKYSSQLEEYTTELYGVFSGLKLNNEIFILLISQSEAFSKLPNVSDPVFFSLSASSISKLIREICEAYGKEIQAKRTILENIAHSKTKNEAMFLAAYWTHQLNVTDNITFKLESLLVESGHRLIQ